MINTIKSYYKITNHKPIEDIKIDTSYPSKLIETCKICKEEENMIDGYILMNICDCKGSLSYIHTNCLCKWVFLRPSPRHIFSSISTPRASDRLICEICQSNYTIYKICPSIISLVKLRCEFTHSLLQFPSYAYREEQKEKVIEKFIELYKTNNSSKQVHIKLSDYIKTIPGHDYYRRKAKILEKLLLSLMVTAIVASILIPLIGHFNWLNFKKSK